MASVKEYAYYTKGNNIRLVERDVNFDNDPNSKLYGPGVDRGQWKSPLSAVANGLQIEYTYVLTHTISPTTLGQDRLAFNGFYGDNDGYLNIVRSGLDMDALSGFGFVADSHIYIEGSNMWNGVHKIKSLGTEAYHGNIQLYTKYNNISINVTSLSVAFGAVEETMTRSSIEDLAEVGEYIYVKGNATLTTLNSGLFKISARGDSEVTVDTRYSITVYPESVIPQTTPDDNEVATAANLTTETVSANVYAASRDPLFISNTTIMEDESFDIDLPDYLAKALEYYLKAHLIEDAGQIEMKEYYLKQFKKQIEKHATSRSWGMRGIASGGHAIR